MSPPGANSPTFPPPQMTLSVAPLPEGTKVPEGEDAEDYCTLTMHPQGQGGIIVLPDGSIALRIHPGWLADITEARLNLSANPTQVIAQEFHAATVQSTVRVTARRSKLSSDLLQALHVVTKTKGSRESTQHVPPPAPSLKGMGRPIDLPSPSKPSKE